MSKTKKNVSKEAQRTAMWKTHSFALENDMIKLNEGHCKDLETIRRIHQDEILRIRDSLDESEAHGRDVNARLGIATQTLTFIAAGHAELDGNEKQIRLYAAQRLAELGALPLRPMTFANQYAVNTQAAQGSVGWNRA